MTPTRLGHLLNPHWHIITSQSLYSSQCFTLGIVYSLGLDKCVMICIYYYSIIHNILTAKKNLISFFKHKITNDFKKIHWKRKCSRISKEKLKVWGRCIWLTESGSCLGSSYRRGWASVFWLVSFYRPGWTSPPTKAHLIEDSSVRDIEQVPSTPEA